MPTEGVKEEAVEKPEDRTPEGLDGVLDQEEEVQDQGGEVLTLDQRENLWQSVIKTKTLQNSVSIAEGTIEPEIVTSSEKNRRASNVVAKTILLRTVTKRTQALGQESDP